MQPSFFPRKIYFAFDADETSLDGLATVHRFADAHDLEVVVGHVVDAQSPALEAEQRALAMLRQVTADELDGDRGDGGDSGEDVPWELDVTRDDEVADGVVQSADEAGADLLALTTHDRKGFARIFSGSVTEDVLARAHVPVLSLRERREGDGVDQLGGSGRILVPVAFDAHDHVVLTVARAWASRLSAAIDLLHVVPSPHIPVAPMAEAPVPSPSLPNPVELEGHSREELLARLEEVPGPPVEARAIVTRGDVAEQIRLTAEEGDYRMVIMGTAGRRGLVRFLLGSAASSVLRSVECPVLLLPPILRLGDESESFESVQSRRYGHPEDVLADDDTSREEKIQILEDWRLDALRRSESTSEGMSPDPEDDPSVDDSEVDELAAVDHALRRIRGDD
ncbi:MAG: universal stress protein [Acidobacteria bacterium]|nr:MAG: universal stress protein [Acidobacteriota bacterium]REK11539.1 MAG: universal stress protein [Acidobacteriota bacterium]